MCLCVCFVCMRESSENLDGIQIVENKKQNQKKKQYGNQGE